MVPFMDYLRSCVLFWCFLFSFFLLLAVPQTALATSPYLGAAYSTCMHNTTNGTALSSTFKHNLNTALQNLTRLSSLGTKYAITSTGSGDDRVYAVFQCRGDQSMPLCSECVANATVRLPQQVCPTSIGARIQLDGCYLRYDNISFFTLDVSYAIGYCYSQYSDVGVLSYIYSLVQNVTTEAPKHGGFASASGYGEYSAAQCLGYLNESECAECLATVPYKTLCNSILGEQVHLTSCYYRFEPYNFLAPMPTSPAPTSVSALGPWPTQNRNHKASKIPVIAATISIASVLALCMTIFLFRQRRKARKKTEVRTKQVKRQASWPQPLVQTKAQVFRLEELELATRHFHLDNKLGGGGYGFVYKGTLPNGEQVAIKKLATWSRQGRQEFLNEVNLITSVQHKNLIRLLGSCVEESERILVYEYLPNKSLDFMLFGEQNDGTTLSWPTRYGIVLGIAKGLAYLHEESHIRIIHRDIKSSNILLDYHLNPVIADFGLARLVQHDETHINTRVVGTLGYLAPEYALRGELSEKVDVFSFGLVSLEILSGIQSFNNRILEWAWRLFTQKKIFDIVDTKLGDAFSVDQVIRIMHVALLCTQESPRQRPTMSSVVLLLSGQTEILEIPHKPLFVNLSERRMPTNTRSAQSSPTSSYPSGTQRFGRNEYSHNMSNATYATSEIIDPR